MAWYAWFIVLGVIAIIVFAIAIFRRNPDRSGARDNTKRVEKIGNGVDKAGESNNRTAEHLETLGND
ncbi:hypothetical protein KAR91_06055, partial [Candidatus Pacearchaeota archaeon]|nr:hypothetical protein [Candidatus Pacearchaeota archaeon]